MSDPQSKLRAEGLALLRRWLVATREEFEARMEDVASLMDELGERPFDPVVQALLASIPAGDAVEVASGTGRHLAFLAERGHRVVGVDASPEMPAMAAERIPGAVTTEGRLEAIPLPDASADLVVCTLALTRFESLDPPLRELRRVARPGGRVVISDVHPLPVMLGAPGAFRTEGGLRSVPNHVHQVSDYLAAFDRAGLTVLGCQEPPYEEDAIVRSPAYQRIPDGLRAALVGLPAIIVWDLEA